MTDAPHPPQPSLGPGLTLMMAAAAGIAVANIYYNQPMLGVMEAAFPGSALIGFVPTATQIGYAAGLLFLVPLGDLVDRRRLIALQFVFLAAAAAVAAVAPDPRTLVAGSILIGAASAVAQQIVPFAAVLSAPERRGRTIGVVMAGLLCGILFSRTIAGFVATHAGWRAMFAISVPIALASALALRLSLPRQLPSASFGYAGAMRSLVTLWLRFPVLRRATYTQAALFGAFSVFWTVLAFHLAEPRFGYGADVAGLFGLIGAVGVLAAPAAGHLADFRGPRLVIALGGAAVLATWIVFAVWDTTIGLVVGVLMLDFGVQSSLVSHQHIVYALDPAARSRVNTVFMTGMFMGGAIGSAGATAAWAHGGWPFVCGFGALLSGFALVVGTLAARRPTA